MLDCASLHGFFFSPRRSSKCVHRWQSRLDEKAGVAANKRRAASQWNITSLHGSPGVCIYQPCREALVPGAPTFHFVVRSLPAGRLPRSGLQH